MFRSHNLPRPYPQFAIIAPHEHGKSTLTGRLIQACDGFEAREMREQVLDIMEVERGITIKAQTASTAGSRRC